MNYPTDPHKGYPDQAEQPGVIDAEHVAHQRAWSEATFGPSNHRGPEGPLDHLRKPDGELDEVAANPYDLGEWVDVIILAFDGAWRAGHEPQQIIDAVKAKQAKNEARTWPDWRGLPGDVAIEHVREEQEVSTHRNAGMLREMGHDTSVGGGEILGETRSRQYEAGVSEGDDPSESIAEYIERMAQQADKAPHGERILDPMSQHFREPTRTMVGSLQQQVRLDRLTAYWGAEDRKAHLDAVEAWLDSLGDWLPQRPDGCVCDYNPETTDGPEEFCPEHGRPYTEVVEILHTVNGQAQEALDSQGAAAADAIQERDNLLSKIQATIRAMVQNTHGTTEGGNAVRMVSAVLDTLVGGPKPVAKAEPKQGMSSSGIAGAVDVDQPMGAPIRVVKPVDRAEPADPFDL